MEMKYKMRQALGLVETLTLVILLISACGSSDEGNGDTGGQDVFFTDSWKDNLGSDFTVNVDSLIEQETIQNEDCSTARISCENGPVVILGADLKLSAENSVALVGGIKDWLWEVEAPEGATGEFIPSADVSSTSYNVDKVGTYTFFLTVWDGSNKKSCRRDRYEVSVVKDIGISVELTWHTPGDPDETDEGPGLGSDLDLHFKHELASSCLDGDNDGKPDGWFDLTYDCYFLNDFPDWGSEDSTKSDDPHLFMDDADGNGPEKLRLMIPEDGREYTVGVHYHNARGYGKSYATIRVMIDSLLVYEASDVELEELDLWEVCKIPWPAKEVEGIDDDGNSKIMHDYINPHSGS